MCPDAELLSAFTDGEVPSPWRERIAAHLEGCARCAATVEGFRGLSARLRSRGGLDEAAVASRIAARLGLGAGPSEGGLRLLPTEAGRPRRGLALPLPAAAAAALALLGLGLVSGRVLLSPAALARAPAPSPTLAIPTAGSGSPTMDSLVRYLEAQNAPVSITIQLPANPAFTGGGAPMIVKTPPSETVSLPPAPEGLGFVMTGEGK